MIKILVIPDPRLVKEDWIRCLRDALDDLYYQVDLTFYELKEIFDGWHTDYEGIKEFRGNPLEVAKVVKDTEILVVHFAPVSRETFESGKNLKLVACARSTPLNIDVEAASVRKIPVIYGAGRNADSVADFTMGILLSEVRHIARAFEAVRDGTYPECRKRWRQSIPELKGKTLGIIGVGNIGRRVAERAKGFGLNLIGYDPYISEEEMRQYDVVKTTLDTLLTRSDFVSINVRLTAETTHMIGERELSLMKSTAFLINTSRGAVIDEKALYQILSEQKIAGAALDVFVVEPIYRDLDNQFIHLDNITVTPHLAGPSDDMFYRGACIASEDIARFLRGEEMRNILNRRAYEGT